MSDTFKPVLAFVLLQEKMQLEIELERYSKQREEGSLALCRGSLHALDKLLQCEDQFAFAKLIDNSTQALEKSKKDHFDYAVVSDAERRRTGLTFLWHFGIAVEYQRIYLLLQTFEKGLSR